MTQTQNDTNDPWAAAGAAPASAGDNGSAEQGGQGLMPPAEQESGIGGGALFNGGGRSLPSLFNKTHFAGTERTGVVTDIKDVHSRELVKDENGKLSSGELKYWEDGNSGKGVKPVTYAISKITGKQNRKVMDIHLLLATEYRMTDAEAGAVQRDADFVKNDDGGRAYVVGNVKDVQAAIATYNTTEVGKANPIKAPADIVGKRLTVKRMNNPGEKRNELIRFSAA